MVPEVNGEGDGGLTDQRGNILEVMGVSGREEGLFFWRLFLWNGPTYDIFIMLPRWVCATGLDYCGGLKGRFSPQRDLGQISKVFPLILGGYGCFEHSWGHLIRKQSMKVFYSAILTLFIASCLILSSLLVKAILRVPENHVQPERGIVLRLGSMSSPDGVMGQAIDRFVEDINRRTGGKVIVKAQADGVDVDHLVSLTAQGELDMVLLPVSELGRRLPGFWLIDFPFYFSSPEENHQFLDGDPGSLLLKKLHTLGLVGLSYWEEGFRQIVANRQVAGPDDLKKMQFGIVPGGFSAGMFSGEGITHKDGKWGSLGENVFDATMDARETLVTKGVLDHLSGGRFEVTLSQHAWQGMVFSLGSKKYRSLPTVELGKIKESVGEVGQWLRQRGDQQRGRLEHDLVDAGVVVHRMVEQVRESWTRKARRLAQGYEEILGAEILSRAEELGMGRKGNSSGRDGWIVGVDADFSSAVSRTGLAIKRGVGLAIEEINGMGGISGKPLRMVAMDNRGSASVGVRNVMRLGQQWGAVAVVAGGTDAVVVDQIPIAKGSKMVVLVPSAATVGLVGGEANRHVFRLAPNEYHGGMTLVDELLHGHTKVALMLENTVTGRGVQTIMTRLLNEKGIKGPMVVWFNVGEKVFMEPLQRMQKEGITAFILGGGPQETRQILTSMEALSYQAKVLAHHGCDGIVPVEKKDRMLPGGTYDFIQTYSLDLPWGRTPMGEALRTRYLGLFRAQTIGYFPDPSVTAQAYDLTLLLGQAMMRSPERIGEGLELAMERLEAYPGAVKDYVWPFSPMRHEGLSPDDVFMAQFNIEGMLVPYKKVGHDKK